MYLRLGAIDLNPGGLLADGAGAGGRDHRHAHQPRGVQQDQVCSGIQLQQFRDRYIDR